MVTRTINIPDSTALKRLAWMTGLIICLIFISGCASKQTVEQGDVSDPFEPVNRTIFRFNEFADKYVARPVAKGYQFIFPSIIRTGVNNFFDNISYPVDILNAALQGKFKQAGLDTSRLIINSTIGVLGIMDPATGVGLAKNNEDFGQTFGVWGIPQGPYIMVPFFGPRTIRSGAGDLAGIYVNPQFWLFSSSVQTKLNILWLIHERSTLIGIDEEVRRAFDPYAFVRDAYLQNRQYLLYDGNPPEVPFDFEFDDEEFDEEFE
jgi:phospholipid-binding lipoprotein MlaA